jgi:hypothetical protein
VCILGIHQSNELKRRLGCEKRIGERRQIQRTLGLYQSPQQKSGWKATQTNFTTGVRGFLHTNQFVTRLETLGVKNKNTREIIRNRTVQKTLSMSDMILKFFFIALNSNIDWNLESLPNEINNNNMEKYSLYFNTTGSSE